MIVVQGWDYYISSIYTPEDYNRDRREFRLSLYGDYSYNGIQSFFAETSKDQSSLLENRNDIKRLCDAICYFQNLRSISISFTGLKEPYMLWFASRVFVEWEISFPLHLETIMHALINARRAGVAIRQVKIDGFYAQISPIDQSSFADLLASALLWVEDIQLFDSSSVVELFCRTHLPSLKVLELANCSISGSDLITLFENTQRLNTLNLHNICLPHQHVWGTNGCSKCSFLLFRSLNQISRRRNMQIAITRDDMEWNV